MATADWTDDRIDAVREAGAVLLDLCGGSAPEALVVLGTGLGAVTEDLAVERTLGFDELPGYGTTDVEGQAGRFVYGTMAERRALFSMGRLHLYQGHPLDRVALAVRAAAWIGVPVLIATNAVGGVSPAMVPGSVVLVTDHINLLDNPLTGPNLAELGERFPVMADAYDGPLGHAARDSARAVGVTLLHGVYAGVPGPSFETRAEVRALATLGADIVGMSLPVEVVAARHAGMRVVGLSLVTNAAAATGDGHDDVLEQAAHGAVAMKTVIEGILSRL